MNEEYFQYALRLLDGMSDDDFEAKLREHGFNPRRKVAMYAADETYAAADRAFQEALLQFELPSEPVEFWAANDNSYALAA